ncbi:bifunctional peptidase and arginyl-hydroxylase JMJD5 [Xylocopa sonorina]|uniref:bifunctional peptidase and arginyl-hydroxylase JMJD5 n=1 Tax=Xylocopa sonorina TaxID=1818115 RepID=UPI00403B364C
MKMCDYLITAKLVPWDLIAEAIQNCLPIEMKIHLTTLETKLKTYIENKIIPPIKWTTDALILVDACLDKTWEILNSCHWQFVPIEYRYCYSLCSILKAVLLEYQYDNNIKESTENAILLKSIIQQIDKGILLGAPLPNVSFLLPKIASELNNQTITSLESLHLEELVIDSKNLYDSILPGCSEVAQYVEPSMECFYKEIFVQKKPAILKDCIKHWKALNRWKNIEYLIKVAGNRIVPIEIGSRYTDESWTQQLLNFSEFLQKYVLAKSDQVGYLAQHQLFDQIPELKDDFAIPEYCNFTDNNDAEPDDAQPDINAWFGPSGTISPLHFDPKNNLLCQVFGYKKVILYHPNDSSNLYPYDTRLLNNTAQVDPLNPNYKKWPNFSKTKGYMAYLKPGEMLYIPPKWWHHVTSLTPSFSISFWWN